MLGAIAGDMAGSAFEFHSWEGRWEDIPLLAKDSRFTDDTVLTIAIADAIMKNGNDEEAARRNMRDCVQYFARQYPNAGYGGSFAKWIYKKDPEPYNSYGNGSAMRVSPVGWAYDTLDEVEKFAKISAEITHNHPEGIKGACVVAGAIFLARNGEDKGGIREYAEKRWGYDLSRTLEEIRADYGFDVTCQGSVPEAITAFLESEDYSSAIRKAIWLGGDADTQAAIAGSIAQAYYKGVPESLTSQALYLLHGILRHKYMEWEMWLGHKFHNRHK